MKNLATLTSNDVFLRLQGGECLRLDAAYSYQSRFDDQTQVPHQIMLRLVDEMKIIAPTQRGQPWVLNQGVQ